MPRAVWTGSLSFGLVVIPVALFPATEPKDVRFHLFDRETGRRIRYRRVAEGWPARDHEPMAEGVAPVEEAESPVAQPTESEPLRREREVAYEDLVRGFEVDRDRYVLLEPEEIEQVRPRRSHTIDVEDFVLLDDIDPVFFEKSYYIAPRSGAQAEKPYLLLLRAMERVGRVGIGRFVLRTKPHLVAIRPMRGILGLETLYFGDEVRSSDALRRFLPDADVSDRELRLAEQLIGMLAVDWDPSNYADDYRQELLRLIAEKTPIEHEAEPDVATSSKVEELMTALMESVEAAKQKRPARGRRRAG